MFARVRDFLYRHRRKFLVGGIIIGGAALLSRYAERKLVEWHDQQTRVLLEKQKKRQHYENTYRTANATVLSLSGSMREVLARELDAEALLQAVRDQPQHKRSIWEQLKVVGFSRAISTVYIASLTGAAIRIQLMLLGGYTFGDLIHSGHAGSPISQTLQQKYLAAVHFLVEEGIPKLVQHITRVVTRVVTGIPLSRPLTLTQLEGIFHEIKLAVAGENTSQDDTRSRRQGVEPWSKYVLQLPVPPDGESEEEKVLYNMLIETSDILDSEDFGTVMDTLVQHGFNVLLDRVADFYPVSKIPEAGSPKENWVDSVSRDLTPGLPSPDSGEKVAELQTGPPQCSGFINGTTVPVAKLVPVLSGVVHAALTPTPGQLLQKVLTNDRLDSLGANVYEAFALPLSQ